MKNGQKMQQNLIQQFGIRYRSKRLLRQAENNLLSNYFKKRFSYQSFYVSKFITRESATTKECPNLAISLTQYLLPTSLEYQFSAKYDINIYE